jgi:uncharacterized phage infection (PIP) family protein YhgE
MSDKLTKLTKDVDTRIKRLAEKKDGNAALKTAVYDASDSIGHLNSIVSGMKDSALKSKSQAVVAAMNAFFAHLNQNYDWD